MSNIDFEFLNSVNAAKSFSISQLQDVINILKSRQEYVLACSPEELSKDYVSYFNLDLKKILGLIDKEIG